MKEMRALRTVVKDKDDRRRVSTEGWSWGEVEDIFQKLYGTTPDFEENPDLHFECHAALHEFNDAFMVAMIALRGMSPSKYKNLKVELQNNCNLGQNLNLIDLN